MINEIIMLTYSIQDSLHDLDRHVDENGRVILDVLHKDFSAMRVYLSQLREKGASNEQRKRRRAN